MVLSLIVWALLLVISVKYAVFVLRADNRGEGGILALTSRVTPVGAARKGGRRVLVCWASSAPRSCTATG